MWIVTTINIDALLTSLQKELLYWVFCLTDANNQLDSISSLKLLKIVDIVIDTLVIDTDPCQGKINQNHL